MAYCGPVELTIEFFIVICDYDPHDSKPRIYRISHFFGPDVQISLKYRQLYRISDILDKNIGPERSDIFELYCIIGEWNITM